MPSGSQSNCRMVQTNHTCALASRPQTSSCQRRPSATRVLVAVVGSTSTSSCRSQRSPRKAEKFGVTALSSLSVIATTDALARPRRQATQIPDGSCLQSPRSLTPAKSRRCMLSSILRFWINRSMAEGCVVPQRHSNPLGGHGVQVCSRQAWALMTLASLWQQTSSHSLAGW